MTTAAKTNIAPVQELTQATSEGVFDIFRQPFGDDRTVFNSILDLSTTHAAVRSIGEKVVSFALLNIDPDQALIAFAATHPDHQRKGHARHVMQSVEAFAIRSAVRTIAADIDPHRQGFITLAARLGYQISPIGNRYEKAIKR